MVYADEKYKMEVVLMDNKQLADLIFPNVKDISYYEDKYPQRNLPEGAIVTRFAPSPTGFVHIGALEQCIVETSLVKNTQGVLLLRIEDTDQKRRVENGVQGIVDSLKRFNIQFNEGNFSETESIGEYGPYIQSLRREIYEAYAKYLITIGRAYPCFASKDELEQIRVEQEKRGITTIGYYGEWATYRNLPIDEAAKKILNGEKYIIRFKSYGDINGRITYKDMIKGVIDMPQNVLDIVIIKDDGLPTYHFAHAVDDHLMHTTHVIRSSEWSPSVPLHLELFETLGFSTPNYCHYAPMLKVDTKKNDDGIEELDAQGNPIYIKRKISKRKDPEAAVDYYHKEGIPVETVNEYLMTIANSDFESWRENNEYVDLYEFPFSLDKMSTTEGALFDMDKLLNISKNVIARFSAEKVYNDVFAWADEYDPTLCNMLQDKEYSLKIFGIERGRDLVKKRKDISKWSEIKDYISYMYDDYFYSSKPVYEYQKISDKEVLQRIFTEFLENYYSVEDDSDTWFNKMKDLAETVGYAREVKIWRKAKDKWPGHVGDICSVIRIGLTARSNTPDLYQIMKVMGPERVRERLLFAMNNL